MAAKRDPVWLTEARKYRGLREIHGAITEPVIGRWLKALGAWWNEDETPWCGTAVAAWMKACGIQLPKAWYRAKSWLNWGIDIHRPAVGCVVVFERSGGGHVGLVVGKDQLGRLMVLGGNQGDSVSIAPFDPARALGFRWPMDYMYLPLDFDLPVLASSGKSSTNEA